ncbi:MAG TPA: M50 family metallopeptidase [Kofleriaceae bacterium]|nr:M50 family metallopeptidase [Kofleriaceae bacterium]
MLKSWRLGSLFGFPVEVNITFLLLLAMVLLAFGGVVGVVLVLLAFGSVVLHELGHALVARKLGVDVSGIELSFFGGAAKMVRLPRTANDELLIAAAGPAVSLALGGLGIGLAALTRFPLFAWLGWTNLIIAGFNLLPALPMDGGRILRALLTRKLDFVRATDVAVTVSRVTAVAFAVIGLAGTYQLLVLAPFLWLLGSREKMLARMMAQNYAYTRDGYVERTPAYRGGYQAQPPRRFTIRQRGGRLVIEEL